MIAAPHRPLHTGTARGSGTYRVISPQETARASRTSIPTASGTFTRYTVSISRIGEQYRLREPVELTVEQTDDGYLISDDLTRRFGDGDTLSEALENYIESLHTYLATLRRNRDHLAPRAARHLTLLEQLIEGG